MKVIVPIKYTDYQRFIAKIKEQLAYFEDVWFEVPGIYNDTVKIYRSEDFQQSSLCSSNTMHICLDNVYYPIDWDKLGISPIQIPIGLRFGLSDGIIPIPNRESIKYTEETKEVILAKIKKVANTLVGMYNETVKQETNIFNIISFYKDSNLRTLPMYINSGNMFIEYLGKYSDVGFVDPVIPGIKLMPTESISEVVDLLVQNYQIKYRASDGRFNSVKEDNWRYKLKWTSFRNNNLFFFSELRGLKKEYLRDQIGHREHLFIKKKQELKLGNPKSHRFSSFNLHTYTQILDLSKYPKQEWRERIKEVQLLEKLLIQGVKHVDDIEIPKEWLEERTAALKAARQAAIEKKQKMQGEFIINVAAPLERWVDGKRCKFVKEYVSLDTIKKYKYLTFYTTKEHEQKAQNLYKTFKRLDISIALVSNREHERLNSYGLHNWKSLDMFMEGKHKVFKKVVTAQLIHDLLAEFPPIVNRAELVRRFSTSLYDKIMALFAYQNKYYYDVDNKEFKESLVQLAKEQNLFDLSIYSTYKEMEEFLNKYKFFPTLLGCAAQFRWQQEKEAEVVDILQQMCKFHKIRLDHHTYLPEKEEVIQEEEQLIEETHN